MDIFIIVILLYAIVICAGLIPLFKKKQTKQAWILIIVSLVTLPMLVLYSLGIDVPSPAPVIQAFIKSIFPIE